MMFFLVFVLKISLGCKKQILFLLLEKINLKPENTVQFLCIKTITTVTFISDVFSSYVFSSQAMSNSSESNPNVSNASESNANVSTKAKAKQPPTHQRVLEIYWLSNSLRNFATNLMLEYYSVEELVNESTNVTGRAPNGVKATIRPIDPVRMSLIKNTALGYVNGNENLRKETWHSCISAMSKKVSEMKKYMKKFA